MTGHGHSHAPTGSAAAAHWRRLLAVLAITLAVLVAEVVGSWLTSSLALLADAAHMATDAAGIGLAVLAVWFGARPADDRRTFGYFRLEILVAVVNATLLLAIGAFILVEAWQRWHDPAPVEGGLMLVFALVGLVANLAGLLLLRAGSKESLNVRGAYLEVLGDLLGSAAVIVAAVVIATTGWDRADVVASVLVAVLIVPRTITLLREAIDVLLEATPRDVDLDAVREHILRTPGVIGTHDLHAWTITSGMPVLSAHVVIDDVAFSRGDSGRVLDDLSSCLEHHFDVEHCTFQIEPPGHVDHEHAGHV